MLHRMTAEEFTEWQVFYNKIEPFGELRADIRSGYAVAPLVNILRGALHKNPVWAKASEWVLDMLAEPSPQSRQMSSKTMRQVLQSIAAVHGTVVQSGVVKSPPPDAAPHPQRRRRPNV